MTEYVTVNGVKAVKGTLDSYSWVREHSKMALDLIREGWVKSKEEIFVFAVGHLPEEEAFEMLENLRKASDDTSLKIHAVNLDGSPVIAIEQKEVH